MTYPSQKDPIRIDFSCLRVYADPDKIITPLSKFLPRGALFCGEDELPGLFNIQPNIHSLMDSQVEVKTGTIKKLYLHRFSIILGPSAIETHYVANMIRKVEAQY